MADKKKSNNHYDQLKGAKPNFQDLRRNEPAMHPQDKKLKKARKST